MYGFLPLRILQAVGLLHRLGYGGLRVLPGMNASGTAWRVIVYNVVDWRIGDEYGHPFLAEESFLYSTAQDSLLNGVPYPSDSSRVDVAEAILHELPSLRRSTPEQTGNGAYAAWYRMLLSQIAGPHDMPVAYADYFDDARGWELGWGTGKRCPKPPVYSPGTRPGKRKDSDKSYVLDLCDLALGSPHVNQKRFSWLRGDPSLKTGKCALLPVDGYWDEANLVVEYREQQHSRHVPFLDDKVTATGMKRGEQRRTYDARKARMIPENGLGLVIMDASVFQTTSTGRIIRNPERDLAIVTELLSCANRASATTRDVMRR